MRGRGTIGGILLLLVAAPLILTFPGAAQEDGPRYSGSIYLTDATDNITIEADQRARIAPGTWVSGRGHIVVHGALVVAGTPEAPVNVSVPIVVLGSGSVTARHTRLWAVQGPDAALEMRGGSATLADVEFQGNSRAVFASGASRLVAERVIFRDHVGEAVYVQEQADVIIANSTFSGNGRGLTLYSALRLHVNDSAFLGNNQHAVVDLGPWSLREGEILFARDRFSAPAATAARLPSLLLRHDAPLGEEERTIDLVSNHVEGAPVGLRAEGRGLAVRSVDDTFVDNGIGVSVQLANVHLSRTRLGNDLDVDGSGTITLEDVTYLRDASISPVDEPPARGWTAWLIGAAGVVVLGGLALAPRALRRRAAPPATSIAVDASPSPSPSPQPSPDLNVPVTPLERRILEDILAHPGTAQRAIAERLGYTRQALHYHVKKLEARGLVEKVVEGRETRCSVPPAVANMLSPTAVTRTGSQEKA